jgi:hypothetical protein
MPVDDSMTREMIAVLDLPGDAPFNDQQMAVLFSCRPCEKSA